MTCGTRRRLSDGRRRTGPKATVAYAATIPAGSAANAATSAHNNLSAYTVAQWTGQLIAQMALNGSPIAVTQLTKTDQTVSTTSNVSFAASMFSVGVAGIFAWMVLALR